MLRLRLLSIGILVGGLMLHGHALATVIDFDTLPDGTPTASLPFPTPVGSSFASLGVEFRSINDLDPTSPPFNAVGVCATRLSSTVVFDGSRVLGEPFNIVAQFSTPIESVSADVCTALGHSVTMTAKDASGAILGSVTSSADPADFFKGTISLSGIGPIARVEWVTSEPFFAGPGIDNLTFIDDSLVLYDDFNAGFIDIPNRWVIPQPGDDIIREITDNRLHMFNRAFGGTSSNSGVNFDGTFLNFSNPDAVTAIEATIEVNDFQATTCPFNPDPGGTRTALFGTFFNTATPTPGSHVNDVRVEMRLLRLGNSTDPADTLRVEAFVQLCTNAFCSELVTLDRPSLGTVRTGEQLTLRMQWEPDNDRFIFQRDGGSPVFSPYTLPNTALPGARGKGFLVASFPPNCTTGPQPVAFMDAFFDDVFVNELAVFNFEDVIQDSVHVGPSDTGISGAFIPNLNLTLDDAARVGGYDHFNWLQIVVRDNFLDSPFNPIFVTSLNNLRDQNGDLPTVPYIDPPLGGYQYQVDNCGASGFPVRDNLDWYLDETFSFTCEVASAEAPVVLSILQGATEPNALLFEDFPNTPLGFDLEFETYLVGVFGDGSGELLNNGTAFRWEFIGNVFEPLSEVIVRDNFDPFLVQGGGSNVIQILDEPDFTATQLKTFSDLGITSRGVELIGVDIKPGSEVNPVNRKARGVIPVALLSRPDFDVVSEVDQETLTFGRIGDELSFVFCDLDAQDVNGDQLLDIVCYFRTQSTEFQSEDTGGILNGETLGGVLVKGGDVVKILH